MSVPLQKTGLLNTGWPRLWHVCVWHVCVCFWRAQDSQHVTAQDKESTHDWMSHVTNEWVTLHIWISCVAHHKSYYVVCCSVLQRVAVCCRTECCRRRTYQSHITSPTLDTLSTVLRLHVKRALVKEKSPILKEKSPILKEKSPASCEKRCV